MIQSSSLAGKRILVTRPKDQAKALSSLLEQQSASIIELPLISIGPPDSWIPFDEAFQSEGKYDWLIFASVNAVEHTINRLHDTKKINQLSGFRLAAIGQTTSLSLEKHNLKVSFQPSEFAAEFLVEEFPGYPNLKNLKILWSKTNIGRTFIADKLQEAGASVDTVHCYNTGGPSDPEASSAILKNLIDANALDIITLTSSQTVKNLKTLLLRAFKIDSQISEKAASKLISSILGNVKIAVIGPETAKQAERLLGKAEIQATEFTITGLVSAILDTNKGQISDQS